MKVRYSPRSTRDLATIYQYLFERTPSGCANVMTAIHAAIEHIRYAPLAAERTRFPGIYAKTVQRYNFKVFYRVFEDGETIEIVHVRHTSRLPWSENGD
jgi:plasmid stabilization system protein ParE